MTCNSADLAQCSGVCRQGQRLCGEGDKLRYLLTTLPSLVGAYDDAKLFSCPLLRPVHATPPDLQLETTHSSPPNMQIIRNGPGEILANYERIALSAIGFCV